MALLSDLRLAARLLGQNPLFTIGIISLLALGIAANTVVFSLVDALLLRPLPVRDPERLVRLVTLRPPLPPRSEFDYDQEFQIWRKHVDGFADIFAWDERDMFITSGQDTALARLHAVSDNFFDALGVKPAQGRLLIPADQQAGAGGAIPVVLSHHYWQQRFGGARGIVGQLLRIKGHQSIVIGVAPKSFNGINVETCPDVWLPAGWVRTLLPNLYENRIEAEVVARLKPGVSAEAVRQQAEAIWRTGWRERNKLEPNHPGQFAFEPASRGVSRMRSQFGGVLWLLMGGVAILGLLVSANIAGLLLARSAGRQAEFAVRSALGASRGQLVRQISSEGFLLISGGALGAVALSYLLIPLLTQALPPVRDVTATRLVVTLEISPDWRILGFSLLASAAALLLSGLLPALLTTRRNLHPFLKEARGAGGGGWRGRQALVVIQVALCTLLLAGAALTLLTLRGLATLDAGFAPTRVVTFTVDPAMATYDNQQSEALRRRLVQAAQALPDVESAAVAGRGLMRGTGVKSTVAWAGEAAQPADFLASSVQGASPEYFETMGIRFLEGRNFSGQEDFTELPKHVIVNRAFVRRFGGGRPVIGRQFGNIGINAGPAKPTLEIIGVVGDAKYRSLREPFQPIVYQMLVPGQAFILHVRTRAAPESVIAPLRKLLTGIDARLSFVEVTTLASEVAASLWPERVAAYLATIFAAAAALIAAGGLYALLAFAVMQRRREIGVRVALGATPLDIVRLIFTKAALLTVLGAALGLAAAWTIAPSLAAILYQVEPRHAPAFLAVAGLVFLITALAACIPSFRASRIHPASVLRQQD